MDHDWWKSTVVYQIYPRSFMDANGDGVGDLQGIISKLDYLEYLGIETVWLSPVYKSPMVDFGYDVSDYCDIDPLFGNMEDFEELVSNIHDRGMRIIIDIVPCHSSDQHSWFIESSSSSDIDNPYKDYYVWHDGVVDEEGRQKFPNTWTSVFGGPAWTWNESRQQYYYHRFAKEQPDLNYRNLRVREHMCEVFQFWLDKGVDGFRIDAPNGLYEVEDVFDKRPQGQCTLDQPETFECIKEWRNICNRQSEKSGKHIFLIVETGQVKYCESGADIAFNFGLSQIGGPPNAMLLRFLIKPYLEKLPSHVWPNFVLGNHDTPRIGSRVGQMCVNPMNVLLLTLPGTITVYQGEELGMQDISVSYEDTQDPWGKNAGPVRYKHFSRDGCRSPMQWDSTENSGFSNASKTWLPIHENYKTKNVLKMRQDKANNDCALQVFRKALSVRKQNPGFTSRHIIFHNDEPDEVFSYLRHDETKTEVYLVIIHIGQSKETCDHTVNLDDRTYTKGLVLLDSRREHGREGKCMTLKKLQTNPGDALIIQLHLQIKQNHNSKCSIH